MDRFSRVPELANVPSLPGISGSHRVNGATISRTRGAKEKFRERAGEMIAGREDLELEGDEITGGRGRMYPDIQGVIVDRGSAKGRVVVYHGAFPVQQVDTEQEVTGGPYTELTVREGEMCVVHGSATVIYYKARKGLPGAGITIRLQTDEAGKFSAPYDMSIFRLKMKTTEFFAWFGSQTGRGGARGPPLLKFTFKDAMPVPRSTCVARLNEDDFRRFIRTDIIAQFDKAKLYMPGLKDFVVLVTDPGWVPPNRRR